MVMEAVCKLQSLSKTWENTHLNILTYEMFDRDDQVLSRHQILYCESHCIYKVRTYGGQVENRAVILH